ncbi:surfeit locus protein 1 [Apis dorsata]|uniref:surfeit locus protein 1 n=1 Tax=Apis dorsata TaxID=7462 RepID=UPI0003DF5247|nr:surfeit locus protein 1 [Apis dorsata]
MKLPIKIFTKVRNPYYVIISRFLSKENLSRLSCNVINIQKPYNRSFKTNLFENKYDNSYDSKEKISFVEYCLLSIPICAFMLGTWQIQRLQWKRSLIDKLKSRTNHEPIELPENLEDLKSKEYYPIKVKGTFLYDKEFMIGYKSLIKDGKPVETNFAINKTGRGYHIITPFKLADRDLTILVNRGWIPKSFKHSSKKEENQIKGETEIIGILRISERRPPFVPKNRPYNNMWYYRDVDAMAKKGDASPVYIEMIVNNNPNKYPLGGQTIVELRNEHLSYILTWYCLSAATAYMWYRKFIKRIPFVE